ncbi:hypothetical protein [Alkalihalobacterium elongatum]|uniref:hypothetical protein n=1 Tax=Alkalihalobacterium elongatum TaxID=2675466 RepID=UPI001C1FB79A|nr:hypothetical protein [Alkalihalobacterium elongatum]
MSRKTFGYGGIAVVLFIIVGALTGVIYQQSKESTLNVTEANVEGVSTSGEGASTIEDTNKQSNDDSAIEIEMDRVREVISESHKTLNVAVGWQGYRDFSWENKNKELQFLVDNTKPLLEDIADQHIEQDILNVIACIEKAINDQDVEGIILAHRIMHDLDYYINGNESDGILYHVTHYGTDQNVEELYSYIH